MTGTLISDAGHRELGRRPPQHATSAGDRPTTSGSGTPPRQMPELGSAHSSSLHPDDHAEFAFPDCSHPASAQTVQALQTHGQPSQPQLQGPPHTQQLHSPVLDPFATASLFSQHGFIRPSGFGTDWRPVESSPLSGTDTSGSSSSNLFDFSLQAGGADGARYREYVSPASLHGSDPHAPGFDFTMPWPDSNTASASRAALISPTVLSGGLFSSSNPWLETENDKVYSPTAGVEEVESGTWPGASQPSKRQKGEDGSGAKADADARRKSSKEAVATSPRSYTHNRRVSFDSTLSTLARAPSSKSIASGSSRPSKLRSASRSSKNTHHKPAETPEQRRSRTSHNLVEKQYRNRLNAQFESLLNALPEQVRGGGDCHESDPPPDYTDKRASKAEVLDMARRHIRSLERERDALEAERNELRGSLDVLRERYGRVRLKPGDEKSKDATPGADAASLGEDGMT